MSSKQQLQDEFWRNISDKYEQRIAQMETQLYSGNYGGNCDSGEPFDSNCEDSVFSLHSEDLKQLEHVEALVRREKELKEKIQGMEKSLSTVDNVMKNKEINFMACLCTSAEEEARILKELEETHWKLRKENCCLTQMLADAREEMNNIIRSVEGPIAEMLRREYCKSEYLQKEVIKAREILASLTGADDDLEEEVRQAEKTVKKLAEINVSLKEEKCEMECRYRELHETLSKQSVEQEEIVKQLKLAIERKLIKCKEICICGKQGTGYGDSIVCPKCKKDEETEKPSKEDCTCAPPPPPCVCKKPKPEPVEEATECTCQPPKTMEKETEDSCHCFDFDDVQTEADPRESQRDAEVCCQCGKQDVRTTMCCCDEMTEITCKCVPTVESGCNCRVQK